MANFVKYAFTPSEAEDGLFGLSNESIGGFSRLREEFTSQVSIL